MDLVREQLRSRLGVDVDELAGTQMTGELPVPAAAVDRLIAAKLADGRGPVTALRVEPLDQHTFDLHVTPAARMLPSIRIRARIEQQPSLPSNPRLVCRWTIPAAGVLARLAGPFVSNIKSLPRGVRIEDDLVFVDLEQLLAGQGMGEVIRYVKALRIDTRPGAFIVRFEVGV